MAKKNPLTMDLKLPLLELYPDGPTRMQVQKYYEGLRRLDVSIRDAVRGTEHALNVKNLRTNASGTTVVYFEV